MQVQWYPGHMTKARRMIEEDLRLIDLVIEIVDARIPLSSRNPDIDELAAGKARLLILAKADLAEPEATRAWENYFRMRGIETAAVDARVSGLSKKLMPVIRSACAEKIERNRKRGIRNRPVRALVAGIPNVGKSTFINSFAGRGIAKTGNKPGVTKGKQWITIGKEMELLDSPGILWPKIEDPLVGERLAMIGSVKDELLDIRELAEAVYCAVADSAAFSERYGGEASAEVETGMEDVLNRIARKRGALLPGGRYDTEAAARILVEEFRKGTLGRFTLDNIPERDL